MKYSRNFYEIKPNEYIFNCLLDIKDKVGFFNLPYAETLDIEKYASEINCKHLILIGIGGSSLGVKAIYDFLRHTEDLKVNLIILDSIDPLKVNSLLNQIEFENSHFLIISKSGNTLEPLSIAKYVDSIHSLTKSNTTVISSMNNKLHKFALRESMPFFPIPENVGGRFSVFSNAGLVPLAILGVDISNLLDGCKKVHSSFFDKSDYYHHIINKARFLVENKSRFKINVLFSYSHIFEGFNKWFVQIWAESLGKKNINGTRQGLTPISLIGPDDQHSFLQLLMDGPRDKTVTFLKVNNLKDTTIIPSNSKFDNLGLNYIDNLELNKVLNFQADATIEAIESQLDIPCDVLEINIVDAYNIGQLIYRYQLLVSCIGAFLQINTFDQPGVELGKRFFQEKFTR